MSCETWADAITGQWETQIERYGERAHCAAVYAKKRAPLEQEDILNYKRASRRLRKLVTHEKRAYPASYFKAQTALTQCIASLPHCLSNDDRQRIKGLADSIQGGAQAGLPGLRKRD